MNFNEGVPITNKTERGTGFLMNRRLNVIAASRSTLGLGYVLQNRER